MIKVAHLNNISQLSGSQLITIEILEGLSISEFQRTIICGLDPAGEEAFKLRCEASKIESIFLESSSRRIGLADVKYFFDLLRVFKRGRYDIVHTNSTKQGLLGRIAAKMAGTKIVIHTVHGIAYHKGQFFLKRILLYLLELLGTLFCDYQILVNSYYNKYYSWIPWLNSITIRNGVCSREFDDYLAQNCGIKLFDKKDKKVVLFLARLEKQKDPITLLNAIVYIRNTYPKILLKTIFRFVGDGDLMKECVQHAQRSEISNHILFTGWSNCKWGELSNADILCVPSVHEACGLVFLEAGLCKVPVVSTKTEGIPEVVINGKTGLLSPVRDHVALGENLVKLLLDENLSSRLGDKAREFILDTYQVKKMKDEYRDMYNRLLSRINNNKH